MTRKEGSTEYVQQSLKITGLNWTYGLGIFALLLLFLLGTGEQAQAQTYQVNSPYSKVGAGSISPQHFSVLRSLGGASSAYRASNTINYANPASYGALRLTTFETGLNANGLWLNTETDSQSSGTASLSYLSFAFPLTTRYYKKSESEVDEMMAKAGLKRIKSAWVMSAGLIPFNGINYDVNRTEYAAELDSIEHRFVGQGQIYQFYGGMGYSYEGLSIGANVAYLFGTLNRTNRSTFLNIDNSYSNQRSDESLIGGFSYTGGLQYTKDFDKNKLTIGATYSPSVSIGVDQTENWFKVNVRSDGLVTVLDTVDQNTFPEGKLKLPSRLSAGVAYNRGGDFTLTADVAMTNWEEYRLLDEADPYLTNSMRFALGVGFSPDSRAITKFFKRAEYRFGGYYDTGSLIVNGQTLSQYAVSVGMGIPIRKVRSRVNLALEVGQRGNTDNGLIRENFLNTTVGITLNDRWFVKRRYD